VSVATAERQRGTSAVRAALAPEPADNDVDDDRAARTPPLALAIRIARLLLRPSDFVDESRLRVGAFGPPEVKRMVANPAFRAPVNRVLATALGFRDVDVGRDVLARLTSSPSSRLALLIVTEPMELVARAAATVAAAVLSKRVLRTVLKTDRFRIKEILGEQEFHVATHEAPLLHQALGELDLDAAGAGGLAPEGEVAERHAQFIAFGHCVLGRFLDSSEPVYGTFFAQRLPADVGYERRDRWVGSLGANHCGHVVKLVRRRLQTWSAIIG
jgi:hypothetical protein